MKIFLKPITVTRFYFYYKLRCDNINIMYTGHSKPPEFNNLKEWVKSVVKGNKKLIYLVDWNDKYVGYLHIDFKGTYVEIGYGVHNNFVKKGIATEIVSECINLIKIKFPYIEEISAWIADFNIYSKKCVLKNGFMQQYETKHQFYEGLGKEFTMQRYIYRTKGKKEFRECINY